MGGAGGAGGRRYVTPLHCGVGGVTGGVWGGGVVEGTLHLSTDVTVLAMQPVLGGVGWGGGLLDGWGWGVVEGTLHSPLK